MAGPESPAAECLLVGLLGHDADRPILLEHDETSVLDLLQTVLAKGRREVVLVKVLGLDRLGQPDAVASQDGRLGLEETPSPRHAFIISFAAAASGAGLPSFRASSSTSSMSFCCSVTSARGTFGILPSRMNGPR